ncbi:hypothetical protein [Desulfotalea psychrophila]|uniref:hypothetical protein n=1 Tax=Desulfotalea psychrophila TaxID=84980 RepID=UPI0015640687|nr:hypothetical protein [Desulfotalea psychrophila]
MSRIARGRDCVRTAVSGELYNPAVATGTTSAARSLVRRNPFTRGVAVAGDANQGDTAAGARGDVD